AVGGVPGRPALAGDHVAVRGRADDREHLGAEVVELRPVARRELLALDPHDVRVGLLGAEHMADDLRRVAAAAARTLSELLGSVVRDPVERTPDGTAT